MINTNIERNFVGQIKGLKLGEYIPSMIGDIQEILFNGVRIGTIEESFALWFRGKIFYKDQKRIVNIDKNIKDRREAKQYLKEQILFNYLEMVNAYNNSQTMFLDETEFIKIIITEYENKYNVKYKGWSKDEKFRRFYRQNIFDYEEKYPLQAEILEELNHAGICFKDNFKTAGT